MLYVCLPWTTDSFFQKIVIIRPLQKKSSFFVRYKMVILSTGQQLQEEFAAAVSLPPSLPAPPETSQGSTPWLGTSQPGKQQQHTGQRNEMRILKSDKKKSANTELILFIYITYWE